MPELNDALSRLHSALNEFLQAQPGPEEGPGPEEQQAARRIQDLEAQLREQAQALAAARDELDREVRGRERMDRLQAARMKVLEQVMGSGTLERCLDVLLEQMAEIFPEHPASVLLLDPVHNCLRVGATLGLPPSYSALMEGMKLEPGGSGSVEACRSGRRVVVDRLETQPSWPLVRELALNVGFSACWSEPILAATGEVLGVFGIYAKAPESHDERHLELLTEASRLAGLVIEHRRGWEQRLQVEKMDALGVLAGGIAHDFNNILSAILSAAELIEWQLEADSPARSKLEIIYKAGQRARELNQQVLSFSRRAEEKRIPFDLSAVVKEVAALLRATLPEAIRIHSDIASSVWVMGDPGQLHQVIMNLAVNGYQALKQQGGTLSLGLAEFEEPGAPRMALLTVGDTGAGMSQAVRERIFEPFFTTKPEGQGTGLGLSVVHGIVHKHGGSIQVDSEPGQGARFQVAIPCQPPQPRAPFELATEVQGGSEHILFVDDEDIVTALAKEGLQALGYQVTAKTSAFDALEVFKAKPDSFDLLVTDLDMPSLSGAELTRRMRRIRPDLPALLVTGAFQAPDSPLGLTVSFAEILGKPLFTKDLARAVRRAMDSCRLKPPSLGSIDKAFAQADPAPEANGPLVLFAEDSKVTRSLIGSWLAKGGYRVLEARDGQAAWESYCAAPDPSCFSLLVTDLDMPRMSGLELVERVRGRDPQMPVLVLTASADMEALNQVLLLHVNEFLNKPFDSQVLLEHVRRLMAERKSRQVSRRFAETAQAVRLAQRTMEAMPEPDLPVYSICEPLTDAGGDVFRCIRHADGSVLLVLADVAGHSVLSSYAVASFLGMLSSFAQDGPDLVELFQRLNQNIQGGPFPETAIAVLGAHWDLATGRMHLVNAGNPYGIWHRRSLARTEQVVLRGTPLGLFDQTRLSEKVLVLEPGDRMLFGTDGLFDTLSPDRAFFRDRVPGLWQQLASRPIQQALGALCDAAKQHGAGRITDDLLVVGLEQPPWTPAPNQLLRTYSSVAGSTDRADRELKELLAGHPLDRSSRFSLSLALHEALNNGMEHGNGGDPGKRIALDCRLSGDTVQVRVVDEGPGFALEAWKPEISNVSERHRGLAILHRATAGLRMRGGELEFQIDLKGAEHDCQS
ncbi:MAG: response regulator [Holophaga sp.]|nr:response regulator [Holophaga sp.]